MYEKYTTLNEKSAEAYRPLLKNHPLIHTIDPGLDTVYGMSSILSLLMM
jgi:hypothetical protein